MSTVFIKILNMSISAGWVAIAVMLLRLLLRRSPRFIAVLLWALVALRLVCPFTFESVLSVLPSGETIPNEIISSETPAIHSGISALNSTVNPVISSSLAPSGTESVSPMQTLTDIATAIWLTGALLMLTYTAVSYTRLRLRVRESVMSQDGVMLCDRVDTPFILGVIRPRVYLPSDISTADREHVIAHERAHLSRLDHLWKPFGFLLLSVHWFNPLLWAGYVLLCRDIEYACDEKVIRHADVDVKKQYSSSLVNCSASRKAISACPLAFGEVGVRSRIKNVLSYKRPALWLVILGILVCAAAAVCLLTDPAGMSIPELTEDSTGSFDSIFEGVSRACVHKGKLAYEVKGEQIPALLDQLSEVRLSRRPISDDRSDTRDMTYRVELNYGKLLCFSDDLTSFWIYTGVKPTLSYRVHNPSVVQSVIDSAVACGNAVNFSGTLSGGKPEGVYLTLRNVNTFVTDGVIDVLWVNNTSVDITYGDTFELFYLDGADKLNCMRESALFHLLAYGVSAYGTRDHSYSLAHFDLSRSGTYRFETCFTVGDVKETVWLEFTLPPKSDGDITDGEPNTDTPVISFKDVEIYNFSDSPDLRHPSITLYPESKTFIFSYSVYSSYVPRGEYEKLGNRLTLHTEDGKYTYAFDADGDSYVFNADLSSEIPEYSYSSGAAPESPVPDGAVFAKLTGEDMTRYYTTFYDSMDFDIDGDCKTESCIIGMGSTSGVFSFMLFVWEDGVLEYECSYMCDAGELSFKNDDEGRVGILLTPYDGGEEVLYSISVSEDGYILLTDDGEVLAVWSKPGWRYVDD